MTQSPASQQGMAAEEEQQLDESQVQQLFKPGDGATTQELIGTGHSFNFMWGNRNGQWKLRLNTGLVRATSRVFVSISEGHMGAARYTLHNVVPGDGFVSIWVNIEWGSPIPLRASYLVIN